MRCFVTACLVIVLSQIDVPMASADFGDELLRITGPEDGVLFGRTVDMSGNTTPADPAGAEHRFAPVEARYLRVNMLYHNLNKGVHLVEARIYGPPPNGPAGK